MSLGQPAPGPRAIPLGFKPLDHTGTSWFIYLPISTLMGHGALGRTTE